MRRNAGRTAASPRAAARKPPSFTSTCARKMWLSACAKTTDNASTARAIAPLLSNSAIVVSMQNGVDNVEQIRSAAGFNALPSVVYVAAAVPEPGRVKHVGRGDLVVGPKNEKTERIAALFSRANVPCRLSENIVCELWTKLVWNCAWNAVSALGRAKYGLIASSPDAWKVVETAVYEVLAVARAAGVHPPGLEDPKEIGRASCRERV